jgi:zinc protease
MRKLWLLVLLTISFAGISLAQSEKLPPLSVKEYTLKNGLTVVLHHDSSTPLVSVNIWYKVGSRNEEPGRTGFAHLFEHLMFQGSKNYSKDYLSAVQEFAAPVNGNTDVDRTFYFEVLPSNFLERALYFEADRMATLADAIDQVKLDNQRDVVKNERRQSVDNVPYGTMGERVSEVMYPGGHPYGHSVLGSMDDLSAASLEDVKSFFHRYYVPNNAVLVLSGDFDDGHARGWINKYFGAISAGAPVAPLTRSQPQLSGIVRKQYDDPFAQTPRMVLVWPGVPEFTADDAALKVLGNILSFGRASRLQKSLLYERELVANIFASHSADELAGLFRIAAVAKLGKTTDDIERVINEEVERIKRDGVTDEEVHRAVGADESEFIYDMETVEDNGSSLAAYKALTGEANHFQAELDSYAQVTAADIRRVANKYLTANHLVLTYVPAKDAARPGRVDAPTSTKPRELDPKLLAKQLAMLPKAGPDPKIELPTVEKTKLSNGLNLWIVQRHELPIVAMNLIVNTGAADEAPAKAGLANLTAYMLNQGTKTRSATDIDSGLQSLGIESDVTVGPQATSVTLKSLTKNLDTALDYFADGISASMFPDTEFVKLKGRVSNALRQQKGNSAAVAANVFAKVVYGDQLYGRQITGHMKTVAGISREDVIGFYKTNYRPNNSTLIVVGDVRPDDIKARVEHAFANWKPGDVHPAEVPMQQMVAKPGIYLIDKPGAVQSSMMVGKVGIERTSPDYYPVLLMNMILGGGPSGRIYANLRQDKGYTYGAGSQFLFGKLRQPFRVQTQVQTISTKESIVEILKEINGIRGAIPVTPEELESHKQALIRRFPSNFETRMGIANQLLPEVTLGIPESYFRDYAANINAVTLADVNRVANKYLDPTGMAIVIVGDRSVIEPKLKELGMPIFYLDTDGNPIAR